MHIPTRFIDIKKCCSMYISLVFLAFSFCALCVQPAYAMHISEGILPLKWAGLWYLVALPFVALGISHIKKRSAIQPVFKPFLGLMGGVVFIISCLPIPVPLVGTCSHPCGTGIAAIFLGPVMSIFIASIALFIQALFLAHGGITTWGANIVSMGIAGSFAGYTAFKLLRKCNASLFVCGFAAGLAADWATYAATSIELALALHNREPILRLFVTILAAFIPTQLPLGILEGFLTGGMIVFVHRRRPDILATLGVLNAG
jgi:cobalt/nickel transport system permease protein